MTSSKFFYLYNEYHGVLVSSDSPKVSLTDIHRIPLFYDIKNLDIRRHLNGDTRYIPLQNSLYDLDTMTYVTPPSLYDDTGHPQLKYTFSFQKPIDDHTIESTSIFYQCTSSNHDANVLIDFLRDSIRYPSSTKILYLHGDEKTFDILQFILLLMRPIVNQPVSNRMFIQDKVLPSSWFEGLEGCRIIITSLGDKTYRHNMFQTDLPYQYNFSRIIFTKRPPKTLPIQSKVIRLPSFAGSVIPIPDAFSLILTIQRHSFTD